MLRLAEHFTAQGRRVGLITNDQSQGLVDTSMVTAKGYPVEEITGGCFCCRFNSLTDAADRLTRDARPDVFLAEPVGSCTDLRATVQYPLRRLYGDDYRVAPLSVLVDPMRAARVLGLEPGRTLLAEGPLRLREAARRGRPHRHQQERPAERRAARRARARAGGPLPAGGRSSPSARGPARTSTTGSAGCPAPLASRPAMDVDYDVYAEGEALLGWLNATCRLSAPTPFDGNQFLQRLADARAAIGWPVAGIEIAHFKMTLAPDTGNDLGGAESRAHRRPRGVAASARRGADATAS